MFRTSRGGCRLAGLLGTLAFLATSVGHVAVNGQDRPVPVPGADRPLPQGFDSSPGPSVEPGDGPENPFAVETLDGEIGALSDRSDRLMRLIGKLQEIQRSVVDEGDALQWFEEEQKRLEAYRPKIEAKYSTEEEMQPPPPFEIPHEPPPHEGALIDYPILVEPPDLLIVEVLEAAPGRPITGQRLVCPDGTIDLDFYGKIHVRGLTLEQVKAKVVIHLRQWLSDEVLGLLMVKDPSTGELEVRAPKDSDRVFVAVSAYNHTVYYVQGDVAAPGRLPFTGNETVLDVLNYAGGLLATADPNDIRLVRPARGDVPARVYPINLKAIQEEGDPTANLQIFPGDRLIVGRDDTVEATVALDRLIAPVHSVLQMSWNFSYALKSLTESLKEPALTPKERRALVDAWVEMLWSVVQEGETARLDKEELREILRQGFVPESAVGAEE